MTDRSLAHVLDTCNTVLFDFDGPLCDVFAGLPAPQVARRLELLAGQIFDTDDPLQVLRQAFTHAHASFEAIEDELVEAEMNAVRLSTPEMDGVRALRLFADLGWRVAIVSNNSADAIAVFLDQTGTTNTVRTVIGRPYRRPDLMKPDPTSIIRAIAELSSRPESSVLIGDSFTDIEAAERARIQCIAYANQPETIKPFRAVGVPVITQMSELGGVLGEDHRCEAP